MEIIKQEKNTNAVRFSAQEDGKEIGRGYLYLIENDLHDKPYGFLEDVFVSEESRGSGAGTAIVKAVIEEAKARGCYKLIGTSRYEREKVHEWYTEFGFADYGKEFRMDF